MPTGDILRATLEGTFDGEPVMIDFGFVSNSGAADWASETSLLSTELANALELGTPGGAYMAPLSEHYVISGIRIQDLSPGVSAGVLGSYGDVGGNVTDDALPPQCALCVTWRTNLKGKANRGRSYLTGFAEDAQVSGFWIGEIQTWANVSVCAPLMAAFGPEGTGNYALSVIHTVSGGIRLSPPTATPITSFTIHNEVRTLRRRGVGVRISRHRGA